jgi:hypothetical protein
MEKYFVSAIGGTLWLQFPLEERYPGKPTRVFPGLKVVFDAQKRYFPKAESGFTKEQVIEKLMMNPAFVGETAGERKTVFLIDPEQLLRDKNAAAAKAGEAHKFVCPGCGQDFEDRESAKAHMRDCLGLSKKKAPGRKAKPKDGDDASAS